MYSLTLFSEQYSPTAPTLNFGERSENARLTVKQFKLNNAPHRSISHICIRAASINYALLIGRLKSNRFGYCSCWLLFALDAICVCCWSRTPLKVALNPHIRICLICRELKIENSQLMKTIIVDEYSSLDAFQPVAIWKRLSSDPVDAMDGRIAIPLMLTYGSCGCHSVGAIRLVLVDGCQSMDASRSVLVNASHCYLQDSHIQRYNASGRFGGLKSELQSLGHFFSRSNAF